MRANAFSFTTGAGTADTATGAGGSDDVALRGGVQFSLFSTTITTARVLASTGESEMLCATSTSSGSWLSKLDGDGVSASPSLLLDSVPSAAGDDDDALVVCAAKNLLTTSVVVSSERIGGGADDARACCAWSNAAIDDDGGAGVRPNECGKRRPFACVGVAAGCRCDWKNEGRTSPVGIGARVAWMFRTAGGATGVERIGNCSIVIGSMSPCAIAFAMSFASIGPRKSIASASTDASAVLTGSGVKCTSCCTSQEHVRV